ncbi:MAG: hypothetical protein AB8I08_27180 [Sandaracinaceae bacterium]
MCVKRSGRVGLEGGDRIVLQAFDPAVVSCDALSVLNLPTESPLVESEAMAPDPTFPNAELPAQPLTLVAVQYDGCARIGFRCLDATPGQDARLLLEPAVHCPDACARHPFCSTGCCEFDEAGQITTPDCDGDGLLNEQELTTDTDGDHTADLCDTDSDGDGLSDGRECDGLASGCTGLSGLPLYRDPDSDGDGVLDGLECCGWGDDDVAAGCDIDGDGIPAHLDPDTDGDGVRDAEEALFSMSSCPDGDCDGDGACNAIDPDSDGDGAQDGRECDNESSAASCTAPWDARQVRCDEADVPPVSYCGACCDPTTRCDGAAGPRSNYCVPVDADGSRPEWEIPGGAAPDGLTQPGFISLQALVLDDAAGIPSLRVPIDYPVNSRAMEVLGAPEVEPGAAVPPDLLSQFLAGASLMTCIGPSDERRCLGVFGIRLAIGDGTGLTCSILEDLVLVVADHFGHASGFDLPPRQQDIIGSFDRGYQLRRDPGGDAVPWERLTGNTIELMRPDSPDNCRGATSQFNFE